MEIVALITSIIKAIPEMIKLYVALSKAWMKAKARKDWDDFEDKFKDRREKQDEETPSV